jgi:hypothetical protein
MAMACLRWILVLLLVAAAPACNRAGLRIPGAAGAFHPARTGYVASQGSSRAVRVAIPTDSREAHLGERVAGTRWKGCRTDPFWAGSAPRTLAVELERELRSSQIFREVNPVDDSSALVLETDMHALCAQAIGFLFIRVAGITSLHFTLRDGNTVLYDETIERVVTDADEEYTGPSAAFIEQAMKILISDSLREVLEQLLPALDDVPLSGQAT